MILLNAVKRISNDFAILKEARREVLDDLMDLDQLTFEEEAAIKANRQSKKQKNMDIEEENKENEENLIICFKIIIDYHRYLKTIVLNNEVNTIN